MWHWLVARLRGRAWFPRARASAPSLRDDAAAPRLSPPVVEDRTVRTVAEAQAAVATLAMQGYLAGANYDKADGLWHIWVADDHEDDDHEDDAPTRAASRPHTPER